MGLRGKSRGPLKRGEEEEEEGASQVWHAKQYVTSVKQMRTSMPLCAHDNQVLDAGLCDGALLWHFGQYLQTWEPSSCRHP